MRIFVSILLVLLVTGCASRKHKWEVNSDEISTDMASLNVRLRGMLVRKEKIKDFSVLGARDYSAYASKLLEPSEQSFKDFLYRQDTVIEFVGLDRDFVICTKNNSALLVLCDKASSGLIDFVSNDIEIDLRAKAKSLL